MAKAEMKSMDKPDETRKFEKGKVEIANLSDGTVGRFHFEPGWKWSDHVKPIAGTDLCQAAHHAYQMTGRLHVVMAAGSELEVGPGEVAIIPPGHDHGWWVARPSPVLTGLAWQLREKVGASRRLTAQVTGY